MRVIDRVLLVAAALFCLEARGEMLWRGDFETGDLSQWHYLTNPQGIGVQSECVYEGRYAGVIEITGADEFLWHGNAALNRSEFNVKPSDTSEGADTFLGWSFYLPEPWSEAKHELGYWESSDSWQQQMRFNIHGEALSFQSSSAGDYHWQLDKGASAGVWHDLAMQVHWSSDPQKGFIEIWHDGDKVARTRMQTRVNDKDAMFTQIGILRHQQDRVERIYIDNARQGETLQEVLAGYSGASRCNH